MRRSFFALAVTLLPLGVRCAARADDRSSEAAADRIVVASADWPWWRGPTGDGIATPGQKPPLEWSENDNVVWKTPVSGRGHGSPTVVGDQVFLATADHQRQTQAVICYDRKTGKKVWQTVIHEGGLTTKGNSKSSQASATVACDGGRIFINFLNDDAIYTTALTRDGKQLWQTKITDYVVHQGYGSSPRPYRSLVLVSADNKGGGAIAGLDRSTGSVLWKQARPKTPNYASPIVLRAAGREQLVLTGCDLVSAFDPDSGKKVWEIEGATTECVTSTVTDGELVFTSGGYPKNHVSAVRADGSGEVVWEKNTRVYVPSMLVHDGYLYAVGDAGIAMCWRSDSGKEIWKQRLGGTFTASLVLVGDHLLATNESGRTFVFKANPTAFEPVAENDLGDQMFATPAVCGDRIYMRVAHQEGDRRQEMLYCIGHAE